MPFYLKQTVQVPSTNDEGDFEYKDYEAEVGTISKAFLGFEADHNIFGFSIEIEELYSGYKRSTGHYCLGNDPQSMAMVREIIKTLGGSYASFNGLVGRPAILLRDRDSATPVGVASPVTHELCLFKTDYSIVEEDVDVPF